VIMSLRALVVDDSRLARKLLSVALQNTAAIDWQLQFAESGLEAIKCLKEFEFDLVLTDVNMPELSGQGLLRYIRAQPRFAELPVVIVSSVGSGSVFSDLVEMGATLVLSKPINTPESMARLSEVVAELLR